MMQHESSISKVCRLVRPGFLVLGLWAGLLSCASSPKPDLQVTDIDPNPVQYRDPAALGWTETRLRQMSEEEKIGQFLTVGFAGTTVTPQVKRTLSRIKPGGLILFSRNIKSFNQLRKLTDDLQKFAASSGLPPFLIMIDQEGGSVTRVKIGSPLPSALALSKTKNPEFIRSYSSTMGELLNRLGINMNLAPVLDMSDPKEDSFIGSRSFGDSAEMVSKLGIAFAQGQWDAGVIPTAKHFPGHGGITQDSHKVTPVKDITLNELLQGEGQPFVAFTQLSIPTATMLGHVMYPNIDPKKYPAAFSQAIGDSLLRKKLKYTGIVMTDDLEMSGAEVIGNMAQRTVQAIRAGNDMIMVAWSENRQAQAHEALLKALRDGSLSEQRINESVMRILSAKHQLLNRKSEFSPKSIKTLQTRLATMSKDIKKLSFQSALNAEIGSELLSFNGDPTRVLSSDEKFYRYFRRSFQSSSKFVPISKGNISSIVQKMNQNPPTSPFVFYVSGLGTARWLEKLSPEVKRWAIVINTNQPGAINLSDKFLKVVHINSLSPESGEWLAQYLNPLLRRPAGG